MHSAEVMETKYGTVVKRLCEEFLQYTRFDTSAYENLDVKRGLRNADGTGVLAGLTKVCNVHGYVMDEGEKSPIDGELIYRGINVKELIDGCTSENRFGYEETAYLLLFGKLPSREELTTFCEMLEDCRELPDGFSEDMIMKVPSPNIMNKIGRSILALYSYDDKAEDTSVENILRQSILLLAMTPEIMVNAYQVKRRHYDHKSMYVHPPIKGYSIAESILSEMRADRQFTPEEAKLLDLCLILHAEHGGGNNSTFVCRALTSSGTDTYSAISGAVGSLKGPRHGGANLKVMEMLGYIEEGVKDWDDDDEVSTFLNKLMHKEAGDKSGLIYGIGHAVYTKSDPRAIILRDHALELAKKQGFEKEFRLLQSVERLAPSVFAKNKGDGKYICANVDLYSGLVYKMLKIPPELFTPLFAISRMAGWCAHRLEESVMGNRIMRPAYKSIARTLNYIPLDKRI